MLTAAAARSEQVGAKLSAVDMMAMGTAGLPAVFVSVGVGLTFVTWFGGERPNGRHRSVHSRSRPLLRILAWQLELWLLAS